MSMGDVLMSSSARVDRASVVAWATGNAGSPAQPLHHQLRLREQIAISSELKWTDCHDHSIYPSC